MKAKPLPQKSAHRGIVTRVWLNGSVQGVNNGSGYQYYYKNMPVYFFKNIGEIIPIFARNIISNGGWKSTQGPTVVQIKWVYQIEIVFRQLNKDPGDYNQLSDVHFSRSAN